MTDVASSTKRETAKAQPPGPSVFQRFFRRPPKQSRSRAVVSAVVEALDEHLRRGEGLPDLRIESLVRRAGVGIGSFYEYFSSKEALLGALIGRVTRENFDSLVVEVDAADQSSLEALAQSTADAVVQAYLAHPARTRVVISGIVRLGLVETIIEERDRFADVLADRVAKLLPERDSADLRSVMRMVSDSAMGVISAELYRSQPRPLDDISTDIAKLALALLNPSGSTYAARRSAKAK